MTKEYAAILQTQPKPITKEFDMLVETWVCEYAHDWDCFVFDNLYKFYKDRSFKALLISEKDFKDFLMWATPLWNMKVDKGLDIKQTIKECINLLSTDGKGTKQQVKERLEELIKDER